MNIKSRTMFTGDNLPIIQGMDTGSVDLIYLDPPFNSKKQWSAPIGSKATGAAFKDTWTISDIDVADLGMLAEERPKLSNLINAIGDINGGGGKSYLLMMASRLIEMHRILKPAGSVYLHCDPTMSHSLKLVMDEIFGGENFRNEIVWCYSQAARGGKATAKQFPKNSDSILYYTKNPEKHIFILQTAERNLPKDHSGYRYDKLTDRYFRTAPRGNYTDESIERLRNEGRIYTTKNGKVRVKYFEAHDKDFIYERARCGNVWTDIPDIMHASKPERVGYPTQKPLKLLKRIIEASSNEGDTVLDPFCGNCYRVKDSKSMGYLRATRNAKGQLNEIF